MKFVIVDDEEVNLIIASRLLLHVLHAKNVHVYRNADDALCFFKNYQGSEPVSLFLDLNMPGMSGWDFVKCFDEFDECLKRLVHIYIISSSIDPSDEARALANPNIISFVQKPLTAAFLTNTFTKTSVTNITS